VEHPSAGSQGIVRDQRQDHAVDAAADGYRHLTDPFQTSA
jgi:hypothetical protein